MLGRIHDLLLEALPVSGAALVLVQDARATGVLARAGRGADHAEELERRTGEGPCIEAVRANEPVGEPDLAGEGIARWPRYGPLAAAAGLASVAAFPVRVQDRPIGALSIVSQWPTHLDPQHERLAAGFAELIGEVLRAGLLRER